MQLEIAPENALLNELQLTHLGARPQWEEALCGITLQSNKSPPITTTVDVRMEREVDVA